MGGTRIPLILLPHPPDPDPVDDLSGHHEIVICSHPPQLHPGDLDIDTGALQREAETVKVNMHNVYIHEQVVW